MSVYTTPASLRDAANVSAAVLDDAAAGRLIDDAEDTVDRLIGQGGTINATTGRAVTPAGLALWRRRKLEQATNIIAAAAHHNPDAFLEKLAGTIKGPDFEVAGEASPRVSPAGQAALRRAAAHLDAAGLRRLTARTT